MISVESRPQSWVEWVHGRPDAADSSRHVRDVEDEEAVGVCFQALEQDAATASASCWTGVVDTDVEVAIVAGVDDAVPLRGCLVGIVYVAVLRVRTLGAES